MNETPPSSSPPPNYQSIDEIPRDQKHLLRVKGEDGIDHYYWIVDTRKPGKRKENTAIDEALLARVAEFVREIIRAHQGEEPKEIQQINQEGVSYKGKEAATTHLEKKTNELWSKLMDTWNTHEALRLLPAPSPIPPHDNFDKVAELKQSCQNRDVEGWETLPKEKKEFVLKGIIEGLLILKEGRESEPFSPVENAILREVIDEFDKRKGEGRVDLQEDPLEELIYDLSTLSPWKGKSWWKFWKR